MSHLPLPRQPAPDLKVATTDGSEWNLHNQSPENFSLVVFYRGLHCPICKDYLEGLQDLLEDYRQRGVEVFAVSMDSEARARKSVQDWEIGDLPLGYGLSRDAARAWGLYLSKAIKDAEPDLFSEPGLFLIRSTGELHYGAINSAPFGRPDLSAFLETVDFILDKEYPPRGEVTPE